MLIGNKFNSLFLLSVSSLLMWIQSDLFAQIVELLVYKSTA